MPDIREWQIAGLLASDRRDKFRVLDLHVVLGFDQSSLGGGKVCLGL
jgi:hypothetical protein